MHKPQELEEFRAVLHRLQARLRGDVEQLEEEALSGGHTGGDQRSSNHMAEMGSDAWDVDFSLHLVENDQEVMKEISAALKRIDAGTFGLCEGCLAKGLPSLRARIPRSRLRAIPYARNCVDCERAREEHG